MVQKQDWMDELFAWANKNNIEQELFPRDKQKLLKITKLELNSKNLSDLPEAIGNLTNLTSLSLRYNQLVEIPESIGELSNMERLYLSGNQLLKLPESISKLNKLEKITVDKNYLTTIPYSIRNMQNLKIFGEKEQLTKPKENNQLFQPTLKPKMKTPIQKILFGSPGTGKSYKIDQEIIPFELNIDIEKTPANVIKTVFHPEYTYGDFVGKLVPITPRSGGTPQYNFYEGHFLKALSQAYKNVIAAQDNGGDAENVVLVIDEINRGNSAAIFGTIFQLLDREKNGWSSYDVNINEITFNKLTDLIGVAFVEKDKYTLNTSVYSHNKLHTKLKNLLNIDLDNRTIKIPPNLSILASMNTSDSSIYYMDSAFKRRWEWEFIDVDSNTVSADGVAFENRDDWIKFVSKLNAFIKSNHKSIRGIEDKQIGHFFITDEQIQKSSVQNKLMFFLWDSVFNRDKKPLVKLLFDENSENELITFGDFATQVDLFIDKINGHV
ncbi:MAG: hypothetical protein PHQ03_07040 [Methylococcales bacterium]|nr:hypothetical protein [Methylococcales bacterium]